MTIKIFLIDEYGSLLTPARMLLETQRDFEVVGEATDRRSSDSTVILSQPDVAVLNLRLPIQYGLDVIQHIQAACPSTQIILLGLFLNGKDLDQMSNAGVKGFVFYEAITNELSAAIRAVNAGERYRSSDLAAYAPNLGLSDEVALNPLDSGAQLGWA